MSKAPQAPVKMPQLVHHDVNAHDFPRLSAYLKGLPDGLRSFPECESMSAFFNCFQRSHLEVWGDEKIPEPLRDMLGRRFPDETYLSTVLCTCQSAVWRDLLGANEERFLQEAHRIMWDVLSTPLYRAALTFLSPNLVLLNVGKRWNSYVKGAELVSLGGSKNTHSLRLTAPAGLYAPLSFQFFGNNFVESLRRCHAKRPRVQVTLESPTSTLLALSWEA